MAILGRWTGGTIGSMQPTTSWAAPNGLFPTQDRNDSSTYSFSSSTSAITLPSSGLPDAYLFRANVSFNDSSNGRYVINGRFQQTTGSAGFATGYAGGYSRDNSEDVIVMQTYALLDSPSGSEVVAFQWLEDTEQPGSTDGTIQSCLEVIPIYYSNSSAYSSTVNDSNGGTTEQTADLSTTLWEHDTASISRTGDVVTVKGDNKRYLVFAHHWSQGRGGRTQRVLALKKDGTVDIHAKACTYYRQSSCDLNGSILWDIVETDTADRTLELAEWRGGDASTYTGGAEADGLTPSTTDRKMIVIELNDSAEVIRGHDSGISLGSATGQDLSSETVLDLTAIETADFNDSASFTRASATAINVEQDMDAFVGANVMGGRATATNGSRHTGIGQITVNGVEQADTASADYSRGVQSTTGCYGHSLQPGGFLALSSGDDIGISSKRLTGGEAGNPWSVGLSIWAINLDTLEDAGDPPISVDVPKGTLALNENLAPSLSYSWTAFPDAGALTLAGAIPAPAKAYDELYVPVALGPTAELAPYVPEVTVTAGDPPISVDVPKGALLLTGKIPTVSVSDHKSESPGTGDLDLTGFAPSLSYSWTVYPGKDSLELTGYEPADITTAHRWVYPDTGDLLLTGKIPTVTTTAHRWVYPGTGDLTLTGKLPSLSYSWTVFPDTGALVLTEWAPKVTDSKSELPGTGSLVIIGHAPELLYSWRVTPGKESLELDGYVPFVSVSKSVSPGDGDLTLTGYAPELSYSWTVRPAAGSLTLTGRVPTDITTAHRWVYPGTESLTLSGKVPTDITTAHRWVYPDTGSLTLSGKTPTVITTAHHWVYPGAGDLTLTGALPSLSYSWTVRPDTGSLTLLGGAPKAADSKSELPGAGNLTITGYAPELNYSWVIRPDDGELQLTGYAPALSYSWTVFPDEGNLNLTGYAPSLSYSWTVFPDEGALSLTGYAPSLSYSWTVFPDAGDLTLTGQVPQVLVSKSETVPSGSLELAGYAPELLYSWVVRPDAGALALTGKAPELNYSWVIRPDLGHLHLDGKIPQTAGAYDEVSVPVNLGPGLQLTGYTPTVDATASYAPAPGAGSLAITGHAPSLSYSWTVRPGTGSLTLTGYEPPLSGSWTIFPDAGDLTLTGKVPSISYSWTVYPDAGDLTLTGAIPTIGVAESGDTYVIVPSGGLTLSGLTPSTGFSFGVSPGTGSLSISGKVPASEFYQVDTVPVTLGPGLLLTGNAPSLNFSWVIRPDTGSLTLTGTVLAVGSDKSGHPDAGSLVITGQAPDLLYSWNIHPGDGSLLLSGAAPLAIVQEPQDTVVPVGSGGLTVSGKVPVAGGYITQEVPVVLGPSLELTGAAPVASTEFNTYVYPDSDLLSITGHIPTATQYITDTVPVALGPTLQITGYEPNAATASNDVTVDVPAGSLTLSGLAPTGYLGTVYPGVGSLVIDGHVPTVGIGQAFPGTGSLELTGYAPFLGEDTKVDVPAGSLTLNPGDVGTGTYELFRVDAYLGATLNITGYEPSLKYSWSIGVPTGDLTISGQAPNEDTEANRWAYPGAGGLTLTGAAPLIDVSRVPDGKLFITGYEPVPLINDSIAVWPYRGSLILTGQVPTIGVTTYKFAYPLTGKINLYGKVPLPTIGINHIIDVPNGELEISAIAPHGLLGWRDIDENENDDWTDVVETQPDAWVDVTDTTDVGWEDTDETHSSGWVDVDETEDNDWEDID